MESVRRGLIGLLSLLFVLGGVAIVASPAVANQGRPKAPLPMIFVHGNSGSAQQFETNAMRFASNGYPQNRIFTLEYDTSVPNNDHAIAALDDLVARVKARTGAPKVNLLAHSRGTLVSHAWLDTPERAANVHRYVNYDGVWSSQLPGGVPTLAIWAEARSDFDGVREIVGGVNRTYPQQSHTEVVNSRQSFRDTYRFLLGKNPKTLNVIPKPPNRVTVKGRALNFPNNSGIEGGTLRVFALNAKTGQRLKRRAVYVKQLGPQGHFGPFRVNGRTRYEFAVSRPGGTTIHNYPEAFERDNHLYRVLIAPALQPFLDSGPNHTNVSVTRMKEFRGDQTGGPGSNDRLVLNGQNVINPVTAQRVRRTLAVFNIDRDADGVTNLQASLAPFNLLSFLTGVDIFLPASADAGKTIRVVQRMRDSNGHSTVTNIPNWPSSDHSVSVYLKDYSALTYKRKVRKPRCVRWVKPKAGKQKQRRCARWTRRG